MKKSELTFTALLVPVDFLMLFVAGACAYYSRFLSFLTAIRPVKFSFGLPFSRYIILLVAVIFLLLIIFALNGLYDIKRRKRFLDELFGVGFAVSAGVMAIIVYIFFQAELFNSRYIVLAGWLMGIVLVVLGRTIINNIQRRLYKYGYGVHHVVILGDNSAARRLIQGMKRKNSSYRLVSKIANLDKAAWGMLEKQDKMRKLDEVLVCKMDCSREQILDLIDFCNEKKIDFKYVPDLFETKVTNIEVKAAAGIPIVELKRTPLDGWGKIIKRTMDVIVSSLGLIFLSPLFLLVAILIKIDSRGPIFVRLKRVHGEEAFDILKFRSMIDKAHEMKKDLLQYSERKGPLFKMVNDPRITRVGRILRKTRIDEFPQLINVLKGEMSLVGPRPHEPEEVAQYNKEHRKVLAISPGITGMAQVSGSSDLDFDEEVRLDSYYIDNWSLKLDLQLLFKTMDVVLSGKLRSY